MTTRNIEYWRSLIKERDALSYQADWTPDAAMLRADRMLLEVEEQPLALFDRTSPGGEWIVLHAYAASTHEQTLDPATCVFFTMQETMRLDVLAYYLEDWQEVYDDEADDAVEVFLARLSDGRFVVVDGNHRTAAAMLTGRPLVAHVVSVPIS